MTLQSSRSVTLGGTGKFRSEKILMPGGTRSRTSVSWWTSRTAAASRRNITRVPMSRYRPSASGASWPNSSLRPYRSQLAHQVSLAFCWSSCVRFIAKCFGSPDWYNFLETSISMQSYLTLVWDNRIGIRLKWSNGYLAESRTSRAKLDASFDRETRIWFESSESVSCLRSQNGFAPRTKQ